MPEKNYLRTHHADLEQRWTLATGVTTMDITPGRAAYMAQIADDPDQTEV